MLLGPISSHPFSLILPTSFPFRPYSLSHHFTPLHLPLYPPCFDPWKTLIEVPLWFRYSLVSRWQNSHALSGPLRLRVQSWSRTRLRIAVSIAFLFRACFKGAWDTIAPLSRGWAPLSGLERGGWGLPPARGCEIGRDRALPMALPIAQVAL